MAKKDYHKKTPERMAYMSKYTADWNKANIVTVALKLNKVNDADIIRMLNSVPSRIDYMRTLVRQDMADRGISFSEEDFADEE